MNRCRASGLRSAREAVAIEQQALLAKLEEAEQQVAHGHVQVRAMEL